MSIVHPKLADDLVIVSGGQVSKRKHESDESPDDSSDDDEDKVQHDTKRAKSDFAPTIIIDEAGGLYMELDGGTLRVSRKAFSLSSPVFLAMLGDNAKFAETNQQTFASDGIQHVSFQDDNFAAMMIIAKIVHLQSDKVPSSLSFPEVYRIAVLCDKYDFKRCLGLWIKIWATPYLDPYRLEGYEGWLFMFSVFLYDGVYKEITRHFILNARLDKDDGLLKMGKYDISERMSSRTIGL